LEVGSGMNKILFFLLLGAAPLQSATLYVAPDGSDQSADAASKTPLRTIAQAAKRAQPGDVIRVRGGIYRESVSLPNGTSKTSFITLEAFNDEVVRLRGSDVVTGWEHHAGQIWKKANWIGNAQQVFVNFDAAPAPLGEYSAQVLKQVGAPLVAAQWWKGTKGDLANMTPGSFFSDAASQTLYVWLADGADPNRATIEVSTRSRVLNTGAHNLVRGLTIQHNNSTGDAKIRDHGGAAAVGVDNNATLENCTVEWADFGGIAQGGNSVIRNCTVRSNGAVGLQAGGWRGHLISGCRITHNKYRPYSPMDHAGGVKWIPDVDGTIENCEVAWNHGSGLWLDYCQKGGLITLRRNYVHNNGSGDNEAGIKCEGSDDIRIENNLVIGNWNKGVYVLGGKNISIENNTMALNTEKNPRKAGENAALIVAQDPFRSLHVATLLIRNNVFFNNGTPRDVAIPVGFPNVSDVTCDYNLFYRAGQSIRLGQGSNYQGFRATFENLNDWQKATGLDVNSRVADPLFASGQGADAWRPDANSPLRGAGVANGLAEDFAAKPRPATPSIGAREAP
jgi:parallel beta-helix repeat protein